MRSSVRKWGNSPSVRIPASVMAASGLRIDQRVEIRAEDGRVIIEPLPDPLPAGDGEFLAAVSATLDEWASPEDETAWAEL
jgi:antitoxin component of MazEF toxin-antitoxin module